MKSVSVKDAFTPKWRQKIISREVRFEHEGRIVRGIKEIDGSFRLRFDDAGQDVLVVTPFEHLQVIEIAPSSPGSKLSRPVRE